MLKDGTAALDWGEDMAQILLSGDFTCYTPDEYSHVLRDEDMLPLIEAGRIISFNADQAAIRAWPPR
jgi:hypothetical protein